MDSTLALKFRQCHSPGDVLVAKMNVCRICGDKGEEIALMYCSKCKVSAGHCYCMGIMPDAGDQMANWVCEECHDCHPRGGKVGPFPLKRSERLSQAAKEEVNRIQIQRQVVSHTATNKEGKQIVGGSPTANAEGKKIMGGSSTAKGKRAMSVSPMAKAEGKKSTGFSTMIIAKGKSTKKTKGISHSANAEGKNIPVSSPMANTERKMIMGSSPATNAEKKQTVGGSPGPKENIQKASSSRSPGNQVLGKRRRILSHENGACPDKLQQFELAEVVSSQLATDAALSVNVSENVKAVEVYPPAVACDPPANVLEHVECAEVDPSHVAPATHAPSVNVSPSGPDEYVHARPITHPIWKGIFAVERGKYRTSFPVAAHLSSRACSKVRDAANVLPTQLNMKVISKTDAWPRKFKMTPPTDESIGLYLFPATERDERVFDALVFDLINDGLALKAVVNNVELLVFSSFVLPQDDWRFRYKYYLWGVFKATKNLVKASNAKSHASNQP